MCMSVPSLQLCPRRALYYPRPKRLWALGWRGCWANGVLQNGTAIMEMQQSVSSFRVGHDAIASYRAEGFVRVPGILPPEETALYHDEALRLADELNATGNVGIPTEDDRFLAKLNLWRESGLWRGLTFHPNIVTAAQILSGTRLRLWHDELFAKKPRIALPTEMHQDSPKWPHAGAPNTVTVWVALMDIPEETGCLTFVPRSHFLTNLPDVSVSKVDGYRTILPELDWMAKVTVPLRAGDAVFFHGWTMHRANPNRSDRWRLAFSVHYVDATTTYRAAGRHVPLVLPAGELPDGAPIDGGRFPLLDQEVSR